MTANDSQIGRQSKLTELYTLISHRRDVADKFSDYWHGIYISLDETINDVFNWGAAGIEDNDTIDDNTIDDTIDEHKNEHQFPHEEDLELMIRISGSLQKLKKICDERTDHWDKVFDETNGELTSLEAKIHSRENMKGAIKNHDSK